MEIDWRWSYVCNVDLVGFIDRRWRSEKMSLLMGCLTRITCTCKVEWNLLSKMVRDVVK